MQTQSLVIDCLGRDTYVPTKPRHRYIALQFLLSMISEFARSLRSLANNTIPLYFPGEDPAIHAMQSLVTSFRSGPSITMCITRCK